MAQTDPYCFGIYFVKKSEQNVPLLRRNHLKEQTMNGVMSLLLYQIHVLSVIR